MTLRPAFLSQVPVHLQIGFLLILSQVVAFGLNLLVVVLSVDRLETPVSTRLASEVLGPLTTTLAIAEALPSDDYQRVLSAAVESNPRLAMASRFQPLPVGDLHPLGEGYLAVLRTTLPDLAPSRIAVAASTNLFTWPPTVANYTVGVELAAGRWLTFTPDGGPSVRAIPFLVVVLTGLLFLASLAGLTLWASRALVAPLRRLADSVEDFSRDLDAAPVPESGPAELRRVARSFNAMRERIRGLVTARTYTLAAIGHDLRTPLTRLRLRVETLEGAEDHDKLLSDIQAMEVMVESALIYLKDRSSRLQVERFDLAALLQTLCDGFDGGDNHCHYDGPDRLSIQADPNLIGRAVTNLIGNAANHATKTRVTLIDGPDGEAIHLHIVDNGPGIPTAEREGLFEPFRRGDRARASQGLSGFGLGLSIARDVVERHRGRIQLADNSPTGLRVAIELPKDPRPQAAAA
ncbi:MAG: hypothetical protein Kilf2KO_09180 [Rhodospirillales bacterium]